MTESLSKCSCGHEKVMHSVRGKNCCQVNCDCIGYSELPASGLLSELEINKQLRKLYPSVEIMTFASRVAQVQQSLTAEEKDNIIHELKVTLYNDSQEIAELKVENARVIQEVVELVTEKRELQSSHQAKIKELFQEIEKIINFGDDWYGMEWENIKSKYLTEDK